MATTANNTSTSSTRTGLFASVRAWLRQGRVEGGITPQEAVATDQKYYEEHGWDTTSGFHAQESDYTIDGVTEETFKVSMMVIGGNGFVHVRRTDGKVIGYTSRPR